MTSRDAALDLNNDSPSFGTLEDVRVLDLTASSMRPTGPAANGSARFNDRKGLRKLSIDKLPQLFSVLAEDMSLVGPRLLPADQVAANFELLGPRHEVRAGITGWWQIQECSDLDAEGAFRMGTFYIRNWSLALDGYILLSAALFTRKGA